MESAPVSVVSQSAHCRAIFIDSGPNQRICGGKRNQDQRRHAGFDEGVG